jgi:hypothetical protein
MMADPLDSSTMGVVVLVLSVLSIPLLMRWHHIALIFSVNAVVTPIFLPGQPSLWMLLVIISLFFTILNRAVGGKLVFNKEPSLTLPLMALGGVVAIVAWVHGGIGVAALGSASIGGRKYWDIWIAIALFFAISAPGINPKRANFYTAIFFLSSLTALIGYFASLGGPAFNFLIYLFPIRGALSETAADNSLTGDAMVRYGDFSVVATGVFCFAASIYGVRGILNAKKPWRILLVAVAFALNLFSGFRSDIALLCLAFTVLFCLEGLFQARYVVPVILCFTLATACILPNTRKLPLSAQRALSFVPFADIDPIASLSAEGSTTWRMEIWQRVWQELPQYWITGKGYGMDPTELAMLQAVNDNGTLTQEGAYIAGDYHSGPLSLIMPVGIFGTAAFIWFLVASVRVLRRNYLYGDPSLKRINTFLYGYFITKIIFYFLIFGAFQSDMLLFAALMGLSVGLNGKVQEPLEQESGEFDPNALLSADVT